ncbi:MAG: hypothetical protein RR341_00140 [Bacteroidales bacterium]
MKRTAAILFSLICLVANIAAQTEMFQWQTYSSFDTPKQIVEGRDHVYFLADGFLYSFGKSDNEIKELSRKNYLSDSDISMIKYCYAKNILVVAYKNSNIDIIYGTHTYNIPYIKEAAITSSKTINNINFNPEKDEIYISTDFGIIIINSKKYEVKTTFDLGVKIHDTSFMKDRYYILANNNLYSCSDKEIPYKFENWREEALTGGINMIADAEAIWIQSTVSLLKFKENGQISEVKSGTFTSIDKTPGGEIYIYGDNKIIVYNTDETQKDYINLTTYIDYTPISVYCGNNSTTYWILNKKGICSYKRVKDTFTLTANVPIHDKPIVSAPYSLTISGKTLYTIPTGVNIDFEEQSTAANIAYLRNYYWENVSGDDIPSFNSPNRKFATPSKLAIHPDNDQIIYVGTWFDGLYRIKNGKYDAIWNQNNSPIRGVSNNYTLQVSGLSFDSGRNLWFTNYSPDNGLLVLKPDGNMVTFPIEDLRDKKYPSQILHPKQSKTKWIVCQKGPSFIFALNINGTLENKNDDTYRMFKTFIDQDSRTIDGTVFLCATEDMDGKIWIGTDRGPIILNKPDNFRNSSYSCYRVKIPRNDGTNNADLLLNDEIIRAIAVDGANYKWIGTQGSGAYLISPDGLTTLYHFTTKNSLIPSDIIYDIAINQETGEVYFATDKGLASFRAEASEAKEDFNNVYAFPNPVRPDFTGVITITGLELNSLVKITDTVGNQIYQNYSKGGQIVWNGNQSNGKRVKSGVYYVWMSSSDGKEGMVAKIVFIN